jgi:hypothetical protein
VDRFIGTMKSSGRREPTFCEAVVRKRRNPITYLYLSDSDVIVAWNLWKHKGAKGISQYCYKKSNIDGKPYEGKLSCTV